MTFKVFILKMTAIQPGFRIFRLFLKKIAKMAKNGQKLPKMAQNHQKMTFFDFQSVYTQNDRNFALILNLSLIFEKIDQNCQKWPKMAQNHQK